MVFFERAFFLLLNSYRKRQEHTSALFIMLEHVTCKFNSLSLVFALWMECESTITREGNVLILYCNYSIHGCGSVELNCCGWILWSKEMTSSSREMVNAIKSKSTGQIFQSKLLEVKPKWISRAIKKMNRMFALPQPTPIRDSFFRPFSFASCFSRFAFIMFLSFRFRRWFPKLTCDPVVTKSLIVSFALFFAFLRSFLAPLCELQMQINAAMQF